MLETVAVAFWAMVPAYVPNNAAVVFGGGRPIDGGRTWRGQRLFGDGKTWRGTVAGTLVGVAVALGMDGLVAIARTTSGVALPEFPLVVAVALAGGAMLGDIVASFLKRRTGRDRGAPVPGLDQLDFVVGSVLAVAVTAPAWFEAVFTPAVLAVVVVVTPLLHFGTNFVAFQLGLKDEPY